MTPTAANGRVAALEPHRRTGNAARVWRAFRRNRIALLGLFIVCAMTFAAITAPTLAPYDPIRTNYNHILQPPNSQFFLGTDELGRDIFSRLMHGAGISLLIAAIAQTVAISIGVTIGLLSGWHGGWVDDVLMRFTDAVFAIPSLMFLIVFVSITEPGPVTIFLALGLIGWPSDARMMRSQVLSIKQQEYVVAAQALGASTLRIMWQHLLPNALAPTIVLATLGMAGAILAESSLSFLGLGVRIPHPSWGTMIDVGRNYTTSAWWYAVFPGLAIMLTVLGFNFVGDGLRDALDPRQYE